VDVDDGEVAMLLIETEGVFEWRTPEESAPTGRGRRRVASSKGTQTLHFHLDPEAKQLAAGASRRRGPLDDLGELVDRARVYVLKFVARKAVGDLRDWLEKGLKSGLVSLAPSNPNEWSAGRAVEQIEWPARKGRLLLMIHGTFSSTKGSFGALAATELGSSFLQDARTHYDAVLGYDHSTLAETPEKNAADILGAISRLNPPVETELDIVAFSRGGLVARILAEKLLTGQRALLSPRHIVFVGCTNGGTGLAEPANWKAFLDLYTNLAVAAGRGLSMLGAATAGMIVSESVKTLGGFAHAVVDSAIGEKIVPGLAAMSPTSELITKLNGSLAAPDESTVRYFVIGSSFEPDSIIRFRNDALPTAIGERLALSLADFGADRLMKEANDLVVDTEAMFQFGSRQRRLFGSVVWGDNLVLYHTVYFAQPDVVLALRNWLLTDDFSSRSPLLTVDPFVLTAEMGVEEACGLLAKLAPNATVVISRKDKLRVRYYVHRVTQLLATLAGAVRSHSLERALDFRETQAADEGEEPPDGHIGARGRVLIADGKVIEAIPPLALSIRRTEVARKPEAPPYRRRSIDGGSIGLERLPSEAMIGADRLRRKEAAVETDLDFVAERRGEVICHFAAEMPQSAIVGIPVDLTVTISREEIEIAGGLATGKAAAPARLGQPLMLEVQAKTGCEVVGNTTTELRIPKPLKPEYYDFRIRGTSVGPAEIWIDARQGGRRLARIALQPTFQQRGLVAATAIVDTTEADPPLVQMRIFETADSSAGPFSLRFVLESRDLNIQLDQETKRFPIAREPYVKSIYERLESEWGLNGDDFSDFMFALRAFGGELYQSLIPESIRQVIWDNRSRIGSIEVISHEPFIPWEALPVLEPRKPAPLDEGSFLAELGLVRWISNHGFPPAQVLLRNGRVRHVIPDYADQEMQLPGAQHERELLAKFFASQPVEARKRRVIETIANGDQFDLLHFACHGQADASRIWECALELSGRLDQHSKQFVRDTLTVAEVSQYGNLRGANGARPAVFLNACQAGLTGRTLAGTGGMAEAFVRAGAGLFVGALWSVGDGTALTFARTFYEELLKGRTLVQATKQARSEAKQAHEPTWLAYTVYGHPYARVKRD
jgi:hypothetical protein